LMWVSSNPDVVSVDETGKLMALKAGSAKVTVSSVDGSTDTSTCRITVKKLKIVPIEATLEGYVYDSNYERVSAETEQAIRKYCERLSDTKVGKMLRAAVEMVGTPYSEMDCSKLTQYAYKKLGMKLPRVSHDQAQAMLDYMRQDGKPQVGDLCFMKFPVGRPCSCGETCRRFELIHHAALYLGEIDGRTYVVDSSSALGSVIIREFNQNVIAGMPVVFYAGK